MGDEVEDTVVRDMLQPAAYWPELHPSELPWTLYPTELCCTLLCYDAPYCATMHPTVLRCTLLCYDAPYCAMMHPTELRCPLLSCLHPTELCCNLLNYACTSVADPDPGSGIRDWVLFDPWIRDGRKSAYGSGIRDEQPGSYFFRDEKPFFCFFWWGSGIRDPGSGMETVRIRDPRWKKVGSGIREKHPGSATLACTFWTMLRPN